MTVKSMLLVGALAVASLSVASAKTYEISLSGPTKAGSVTLKPGQYRLKVDGNTATFTYVETSKQFTTPVKVTTSDKKFDDTRVDANKDGGTDVIKDIELGGTKTKIDF
jgi:maltose-binding protein MalE